MKLIDKLAWIEIRDKKILSTRSKGKAVFYIPGGKREAGESDHDALIREVREELDIELDRTALSYVGTFKAQAHGHAEGIEVNMQCYKGPYEGTVKASAEIEHIEWLTTKDYDKISEVDKLIFDWLKKQDLID